MAKVHGLAIAILFGGLALIAAQILPRTGYVQAQAGRAQQWWCAKSTR